MKRDISHAIEFLERASKDPLLCKQLDEIKKFPAKEEASHAVRLGRLRGLYFSESDWMQVTAEKRKAA